MRKARRILTEEQKELSRRVNVILGNLSYYGYDDLRKELKRQDRRIGDHIIETLQKRNIHNYADFVASCKNITMSEYVFAIFLKEINWKKGARYAKN